MKGFLFFRGLRIVWESVDLLKSLFVGGFYLYFGEFGYSCIYVIIK